eukprot:gb/GECG01000976.1/.p1 GENE.gb/GECG01000976.1/~~gb/GECG01000976.1/.p1  ORF type:complete len:187 (+),score=35.20 gb/GECG01000976.1/:1-561(+)
MPKKPTTTTASPSGGGGGGDRATTRRDSAGSAGGGGAKRSPPVPLSSPSTIIQTQDSELAQSLKQLREKSRQEAKQRKEDKRLCYKEIQTTAENLHQDFRTGVMKSLLAVGENQQQLKERMKALDNVLKQVKDESKSQIGSVTEFRRSCETCFDGLRGWTYTIKDSLDTMTEDLEYIAESLRNETI